MINEAAGKIHAGRQLSPRANTATMCLIVSHPINEPTITLSRPIGSAINTFKLSAKEK
jgi:hypothetical protein